MKEQLRNEPAKLSATGACQLVVICDMVGSAMVSLPPSPGCGQGRRWKPTPSLARSDFRGRAAPVVIVGDGQQSRSRYALFLASIVF
jgi:hypothetical protein